MTARNATTKYFRPKRREKEKRKKKKKIAITQGCERGLSRFLAKEILPFSGGDFFDKTRRA
jgi:hypothetical protein